MADQQLTSIVGQPLQQVCVGPYDVQFKFGSLHAIGCQGDVRVWAGDETIATWNEGNGWSDVGFQRLLYEPIIGWSGAGGEIMRIDFDGLLALEIHRPYSFQPGDIFVD